MQTWSWQAVIALRYPLLRAVPAVTAEQCCAARLLHCRRAQQGAQEARTSNSAQAQQRMSCHGSALQTQPQGKRPAASRRDVVSPRLSHSDQLSAFEEGTTAFEEDLQSASDSASLPDAKHHAEFYDSEADEQDQAWVTAQRQGRRSDAILSCPGCLTTICVDCQRHEYITTQYRAMFVTNCRVSATPKLSVPQKQPKASGKRQRDAQLRQPLGPDVQEQVFPVFCGTCDAELGVQDADEVFHFFSVFPSTA